MGRIESKHRPTYRVFTTKHKGFIDREPVWYFIAVPFEDDLGICEVIIDDFLTQPSSIQILQV